MSQQHNKLNVGLLCILMIILIYQLFVVSMLDHANNHELKKTICHKEIKLPEISRNDRLIIESIISEYLKKRKMNKSIRIKTCEEFKLGMIRGAIGGLILGGSLEGAVIGAVVFGTMGGLFKTYSIIFKPSLFLQDDKHT